MEKNEKKTRTDPVEKTARVPVHWELTEEDKAFLRSFNISPN